MKRIVGVSIIAFLAGCAGQVDHSMYNLHSIAGKEVICTQPNDSIRLVKLGFTDNSKVGQGLFLRKMVSSGKCYIAPMELVVKTGEQQIFPITDEFPESLRGIKKAIYKVRYQDNFYWLVPTH